MQWGPDTSVFSSTEDGAFDVRSKGHASAKATPPAAPYHLVLLYSSFRRFFLLALMVTRCVIFFSFVSIITLVLLTQSLFTPSSPGHGVVPELSTVIEAPGILVNAK